MAVLTESIGLVEASADGRNLIRIIEADVRGSSAYYPADVLERDAHKFKAGTQMFLDHATKDEGSARPEGSVKNMIGVLESDAVFRPDGLYANMHIFEDHKAWVKDRAPYIGLSIRATGTVRESDEGPILESFDKILSVDVVTKAGAGGKFISLAESAKPGALEESSEPLAESKETEMEFPKELAEALDTQIKAVNALMEALKPVEPAKVETVEESKLDAGAFAEALVESGLTKASRARVVAAVEGGAEFEEAIKAEKALVADVLKESKVEKSGVEFAGNIEESKVEQVSLADNVWGK